MKRNTIVKIILLVFFIVFFTFLFYYFYKPIAEQNKQTEGNNTGNSGLFPLGGTGGNNQNNQQGQGKKPTGQNQTEKDKFQMPRLRQISKIPTAGAFIQKISRTEIFDINKEKKRQDRINLDGEYSEIRFVSMKNNHLYRTYDFTLKNQRITNITIPKIFEALFFDKNHYIVRYINDFDDIKSYSIKISDKTKEEIEEEKQNNKSSKNYKLKKFEGVFLPDNILNLALNKKDKKIFYIKEEQNSESDEKIKGIVSSRQAENKKEIFTSELKEWNLNFNSPNFVLVTTKPAGSADSYSMSINTKNASKKAQSKIKKGLNGLPNYNFTKILYSYKKGDKYVLYIKDVKTQEETEIKSVNSIVDKCVWSKNNIHIYCATTYNITNDNLEDWYKGKIYLDNNGIYKIDSKTGNNIYVFESGNYNQNFDIVDLQLDDLEKYLYFKDKKTDFYWSYKIKEEPKKKKEEENKDKNQ